MSGYTGQWPPRLFGSGTIAPENESPDQQNDLAPDFAAEQEREVKWANFEQDILAFAQSEPDGFSAVLRAVARAMQPQREFLR